MLRNASRVLFVARNRTLLATSRAAGTSTTENLSIDQLRKQRHQSRHAQQWETMRKLGKADAPDADRFDDKYQERTQHSLWERAKEAAQAVKDKIATNAEKAQDVAAHTKDNMGEKMEYASEQMKDTYAGAKETIAEKYEHAKEAMAEKLDSITDTLEGRKTSDQQKKKKDVSRTQPLGQTYTKIDMSFKAMNEEITLADIQGDLSHDDETIAHAASRSAGAASFHGLDDLSGAISTEDLAIKSHHRPDSKAEHRAKRPDISYGGAADDFLEPQARIDRKPQEFSENIKDSKKAADGAWSKAGSNFMHGLEQTAEHLQKKEAKKFQDNDNDNDRKAPQMSAQQQWEKGNAIHQSWNEMMQDSDKQNKKEVKSQRKGPAFGLQDLTGSETGMKQQGNVKQQEDKKAQANRSAQLEQGKRDKKGPMYGMEDLTGPTGATSKNANNKQKSSSQENSSEALQRESAFPAVSQKQGQATARQNKKGNVEDPQEKNMAERSNKAASSSKARGSNDLQGLGQSAGDDSANETARNIPTGTPPSSTF